MSQLLGLSYSVVPRHWDLQEKASIATGSNAWHQRGRCRENIAELCPARLDGQFLNTRIMCAHVELLSLCAQIGDIGDTHVTF